MNFDITFKKNDRSFAAGFREAYRISDGGYESGYAEGYDAGYDDAQALGAETNKMLESMIDGGAIEEIYSENATRIKAYAFWSHSGVKSIDLPNVTTCAAQAFRGCSKLTTVHLPKLETCSTYVFYGSGLVDVYLPELLAVPDYTFAYCNSLVSVNLPKATEIKIQGLRQCTELKKADLGAVETIGQSAFYYCQALTTLIIRTNAVCKSTSGAFNATPIANGTGYVYVPRSLVEDYKAAWSTHAAQIRAIEDYPDITGT